MRYIIFADVNNKLIKIIDTDKNKIITDIKSGHNVMIISIKKINHPLYGESLLSGSNDKAIKLWINI